MPDERNPSTPSSSKTFRIQVEKSGKSSAEESRGKSASSSTSIPRSVQQSQALSSHDIGSLGQQPAETSIQNATSAISITRDLWRAAFETLPEEQMSALVSPPESQSSRSSPTCLVDEVISLTRDKCAQYEAGGWHLKRTKGEDFNVRDKAKSLICSALILKDLVDAGLKFDASGYGALVWSVVSFGLQVCENG